MIQTIYIASKNSNKVDEIKQILGENFKIFSLLDIYPDIEIEEIGKTIEENSKIKAEWLYKRVKKPCIADDSGLEVEVLNNEPGVMSARYAGCCHDDKKNIEKLLNKMEGITNRKARFKTVITLINNHEIFQFEGTINGTITLEPRGKNGFGYDPIFIPDGFSKTFGEMDKSLKNSLSHRYLALEKLKNFLTLNDNLK
jgi:XTP/dITP diphosphohydrolase